MLNANYHTHTNLCDGKNTPEEVVQQALALGFTHLGFSGHMDIDIHMDIQAYFAELRRLQAKYKAQLDILMGVELDTLYDAKLVEGAEYVIGSTHFIDLPINRLETAGSGAKAGVEPLGRPVGVDASLEDMQFLAKEYFGGDYYALSKAYYETEAQVVERTNCTFIGHFDLVTRFNDEGHFLDETDQRYLKPALETMEYLVSKGRPFEINCGAVNRGRKKELYPNTMLLKSLREMGGQIMINSDAHQKELLNGAFDAAVQTAVSCGFTHTNILVHEADGSVGFRQIALDTI